MVLRDWRKHRRENNISLSGATVKITGKRSQIKGEAGAGRGAERGGDAVAKVREKSRFGSRLRRRRLRERGEVNVGMGLGGAAPYVGMVMAECAQVGLMIISKQAMSTGMSNLVFVCYSNALASLVLLPFAFLLYRSGRPPLTFSLIAGFFLLGLVGSLAQIFGYAGINFSSPTLGTAMLNLVPGFTFILAIIFRMEKLEWRSLTCMAKSVGTIVLVTGAFVVTLYRGPALLTAPSATDSHYLNLPTQQLNWVVGGLLLIADCLLTSGWLFLQASILKSYPAELIVVLCYCFFVAIQCGVVTLIVERDMSAWSVKPTLRLLAVLYSAVFGSAFQVGICTWCLQRKGPVFVSMFKPLGIAIASVLGALCFGDSFYLGSLIGICIIVVGFYSVMWGKANEEKMGKPSLHSTTNKAPLIENKIDETEEDILIHKI
ncbi:hypothetical protein Nepgr_003470 [Nepenthes gracilis]|uniref:EamA domain-containing protein n=1 Tax=Nepenthes gracilis TaxID=150966 RepID=A0AAD3RZJ5_NEPGR|nr:hypothetical protein Nepgr_003470 [Nepenthes gracilis]